MSAAPVDLEVERRARRPMTTGTVPSPVLEAPNAARDALEAATKRRIVMTIGFGLSFVAALLSVVCYRPRPELAVLCAVTSILYLTAALLAYRTHRYLEAGAMIGITVFIGVATGSVLQGGLSIIYDPVALQFTIFVPQVMTYLMGARSGMATGAATIAFLSAVFAWVLLRPEGTGDLLVTLNYVVATGAIVVGLLLSVLYTRERARTVAKLRAAHGALDVVRVAEERRLKEEIDLAARIQTALLPRDLGVEGLEISAAMLPAAEVGGDYYDVLPVAGGAWLCIGDVAGHGLNAGLTMLMIQSAVSALVQDDPAQSPGDALEALNTTLYQNVRQRMRRDEHATLTLLRYRRDGTVCFAGAHEEILVLRAAEGRCETVTTPGPWVGARSSIAGQVPQGRLTLADGDVLVLYTDGVTEAMDSRRRQFGLERVEAEILRTRGAPVDAIREAILGAVHAFSPVLTDDVALLVARYRAPECA